MSSPASAERAVLVTGAARRIGRTLALDFARRGWEVGVHFDGSAREADALVGEIGPGADGRRAAGGPGRCGRHQRPVAACAAALGRPPAWSTMPRCFWKTRSRARSATLGPAAGRQPQGARFSLPSVRPLTCRRMTAGNIINIIDQRVWRPTPHFFSYAASKAGLWAPTRTLAQALAPRIRVNGIGPGPGTAQHPPDRRAVRATVRGRRRSAAAYGPRRSPPPSASFLTLRR